MAFLLGPYPQVCSRSRSPSAQKELLETIAEEKIGNVKGWVFIFKPMFQSKIVSQKLTVYQVLALVGCMNQAIVHIPSPDIKA